MPQPAAKLRDVARLAGVHPATASSALNPETRLLVSEDTANRVMAAATELGYQPEYDLERGIADYLESLQRLKLQAA